MPQFAHLGEQPVFQSTPSARRATRCRRARRRCFSNFNPRPPRGERQFSFCFSPSVGVISIHALREEGDSWSDRQMRCPKRFQSTPSARRATLCKLGGFLRGIISIHALREESDGALQKPHTRTADFNPRPPRGGRRLCSRCETLRLWISIHALREEGDQNTTLNKAGTADFNPRPPRGGRQQKQRKNPPLLFHYTRLCTI